MNEEVQNVTEEVTENTEEVPVEESMEGVELTDTFDNSENKSEPKGRFVTEEELNSIVDRRVARKMRKYESDMSVYKDTENVLKEGLKVNDINEANKKLRDFYKEEGYELPEKNSSLSDREIEILAKADTEELIEEGYESMLEEANRLAKIGYNNLNSKDKKIFLMLGEALDKENETKELKKLGATEDILKDEEFISFKKKFDKKTPIKDIYNLFKTIQPKSKVELPGSMKNNVVKTEKEYFTPEEVKALTSEEWQKPGVWEKVLKSQKKWTE